MTKTLTLTDAGALAAILSAAERNAPVAYLTPAGHAFYAKARYIGGPSQVRDWTAEADADVRDLYLHVTETCTRAPMAWLIRNLIIAARTWHFMTDTGPLAQPFKPAVRPEPHGIKPWHTGPDWSGWLTEAELDARQAREPAREFCRYCQLAIDQPEAGHWAILGLSAADGSEYCNFGPGQRHSPGGLFVSEAAAGSPARLLVAARRWITDCAWREDEEEDLADLTDTQVIANVQRHYIGGWLQFTRDGGHAPDSDRSEIRWEEIRGTGFPDQQSDLDGGRYYAQIGPDNGSRWSWTVMDADQNMPVAGGGADSEQDAKARAAAWTPPAGR